MNSTPVYKIWASSNALRSGFFSFEKEVSVYTETQVKSDRKFLLIKNAGALGSAQTRPRRKQGSNSFAAHVGGCD